MSSDEANGASFTVEMPEATVTTNLSQEIIVTTRDKVELALRRTLPAYTSTEQVIAAVGVFLTLVVTLLTADFRDRWGVPAVGWRTTLTILTICASAWCIREVWRWWRRPDLEAVVTRIVETSRTF